MANLIQFPKREKKAGPSHGDWENALVCQCSECGDTRCEIMIVPGYEEELWKVCCGCGRKTKMVFFDG